MVVPVTPHRMYALTSHVCEKSAKTRLAGIEHAYAGAYLRLARIATVLREYLPKECLWTASTEVTIAIDDAELDAFVAEQYDDLSDRLSSVGGGGLEIISMSEAALDRYQHWINQQSTQKILASDHRHPYWLTKK